MASTSTTPDRELSEPIFHAKYGFLASWDAAREVIYAAVQNEATAETVIVLRALFESMSVAARNEAYEAYVQRIDL